MGKAVHFPTVPGAVRTRQFWFLDRQMYGATGGRHMGVDLTALAGSPIYAAADGEVIEAGYSRRGGYGRRVVIQHEGYKTLYAHLREVRVREGQTVEAGTVIGTMGGGLDDPYRGASGGVHLHFEVILPAPPKGERYVQTYNGYCVDPLPFLRQFLPPAVWRGKVAARDGVRVRLGPSVRERRIGALGYGTPVEVTAWAQDEAGNRWGRLRWLREAWVAVRWRGSWLVEKVESGEVESRGVESGEVESGGVESGEVESGGAEVAEFLREMRVWLDEMAAWLEAQRARLEEIGRE